MEPAISVQNLSAGYGSRTILENISFDVPAGQIVTILGGSGCGNGQGHHGSGHHGGGHCN